MAYERRLAQPARLSPAAYSLAALNPYIAKVLSGTPRCALHRTPRRARLPRSATTPSAAGAPPSASTLLPRNLVGLGQRAVLTAEVHPWTTSPPSRRSRLPRPERLIPPRGRNQGIWGGRGGRFGSHVSSFPCSPGPGRRVTGRDECGCSGPRYRSMLPIRSCRSRSPRPRRTCWQPCD